MAEKNLETYINEKEIECQKEIGRAEKRKKRFVIKTIIFSVIFVALISGIFFINYASRNNNYNQLMSANANDADAINQIASSVETLTDSDLFDKYESGYLGNKAMNALNYGLLAENQYGYTSTNEKEETILHIDGKENIIATEMISQINITKDAVIYRGEDKKLYSCKHDGSDKKMIIEDKAGAVVSAGDAIYYVNYSKSSNLYKYDFKEEKNEPVIESDVNKFVIIADSVLYSDHSGNLMLQKLGMPTPAWTDSNIAAFYFNGDVYVQNNNKIIKFNIYNHLPKEVINDANELLGVDENNIYYTTNGKLYSQNINSGDKEELNYSFDYYKGVYSVNGKITALGGVVK